MHSQWHILGAGAMGCLWAAHLARDGHPVCLLLRDEAALADYARSGGITFQGPRQESVHPVRAACVQDQGSPIQRVLIATKAGDAEAAFHQIRPRLQTGSIVVLLHNGLQAQRRISAEPGPARVYCLSTDHGAYLLRAFHVVHAGAGRAWLGRLGGESPEVLENIRHLLPWQSLNIEADEAIERRLWQKLGINCAINALTVLYECPNGALLGHPEARPLLRALCAEIESLFSAIPEAPALDGLQTSVDEVLDTTAQNYSSALQDFWRGRATEIPQLNGYLCELAAREDLPCPRNRQVLEAVLNRENRHRASG